MPAVSLPQDPNLGQLRNQARELQRAVRSGDTEALALAAEFYPDGPPAGRFPLSAAQLVIARRYQFGSWARLRRHVQIVTARAWVPGPAPDDEPRPDRFLRLSCLAGNGDQAADRAAATALLAGDPSLTAASIHVAAACADVAQVRRLLAAHKSLATQTGGPHGWSPLLYQAYARPDPAPGLEATLETARLLLDAGADPNDGRFWHGLPTPFTVLTGVLGHGEWRHPWHPHAIAFARLLLQRGADPNDGQVVLYNRMFGSTDDHLVLLFEFGLGRGEGGPWHRLLGDALESPAVMLRNLLWWAVAHGQRDRVILLATHGVDIELPLTEQRARLAGNRTPAEEALVNGHPEVAELLLRLGVRAPRLSPPDAFVAAALAGDATGVSRTDPAVIAAVRTARPGLVTWAASQGAPDAVELLVGVGFDVNSFGRSDVPANDPWHTVLHVAAGDGKLELARTLLELGANPDLRDRHYHATPLGWARDSGHQPLIDLLSRQPGATDTGTDA
jgi:ankyrin repeat protein